MLLLPKLGNAVISSNTVISRLRTILPPDVHVKLGKSMKTGDTIVDIERRGSAASLVVAIKNRIEPRDASALARHVEQSGARVLVAAPFISPATRTALKTAGFGFIDLTGNVHLNIDEPSILIDIAGNDIDPNPAPHPIKSFSGPATGRVIRYLCEHRPPYGVRFIAAETGLNPGNVSRIVDAVEREALLERTADGTIVSVDWRRLIESWSKDLPRRRIETGYLEPRGLNQFFEALRATSKRYALTSQAAAVKRVQVAPVMRAQCYCDDIEDFASELHIRGEKRGANVFLVEAFDPVVFENTIEVDGLTLASPPQVAADLFLGYARDPREADAYLDWMARNEGAWRA